MSGIHSSRRPYYGVFTIVELLIVVVIIAILAAITVAVYSGVQARARTAKIQQDIASLEKAIMVTRVATGKTLYAITSNTYTANSCTQKVAGTDLSSLPASDACWTAYRATLAAISSAGVANVANIVDPWGRPYYIDENENEQNVNDCRHDVIGVYPVPFAQNSFTNGTSVPFSGYTTCTD